LARGSDTIRRVPCAGSELVHRSRIPKLRLEKSKAKLSNHPQMDRTETVVTVTEIQVKGS